MTTHPIIAAAPVYLDHAATTPVLPEVVAAMGEVMVRDFGNPSSRHGLGLVAERHLRAARQTVARALGVPPEQVVFTSGGTEANALAILGAARAGRRTGHVLISAVEHASVIETARSLEAHGFLVDRLPVNRGGFVEPMEVSARMRPETCLVAVMHVNNETGIRQPVEDISRLVKASNPRCLLLVDAVQSFGVMPVGLDALGADLLSLSAHKIHGPKGVGCLVLAKGVRLSPMWGGGDQEAGRRPGTENVPGIVGLARATELASAWTGEVEALAPLLLEGIARATPEAYPVGDPTRRAAHILSVAVPGVRSEVLSNLLEERGVIVGSGAACHSRRSLRSHVLEAMGVPREHGVVRFSLSPRTTRDAVCRAAEVFGAAVQELRTGPRK